MEDSTETKIEMFDWVEIGTSDFDTLASKARPGERGISIEPIRCYLDRVISQANIIKVCAAIGEPANWPDKFADAFYLQPEVIEKYKLPQWIRGCNSLYKPHPYLVRELTAVGAPTSLISSDKVRLLSWKELVDEHDISEITYLKCDTEGHDAIIINQVLDVGILPTRIMFESNEHSKKEDVDALIQRLATYGYKVISRGYDTVVEKSAVRKLNPYEYGSIKCHESLICSMVSVAEMTIAAGLSLPPAITHNLLELKKIVNNPRHAMIFCGVRNPFERNISYFWRMASKNELGGLKCRTNNYTGENIFVAPESELGNMHVTKLWEHFFKDVTWQKGPSEWLSEFLQIVGEVSNNASDDASSSTIMRSESYVVYSLGNGLHITFYKTENLDENMLVDLSMGRKLTAKGSTMPATCFNKKQLMRASQKYTEEQKRMIAGPVWERFYDTSSWNCTDDDIIGLRSIHPNVRIMSQERYAKIGALLDESDMTASPPSFPSFIPQKLHLIWVGRDPIPDYLENHLAEWKSLMPSWEIRLWTNDDLPSFPQKRLIAAAKTGAQKADIMRYYIIEEHGGFYVDADIQPHSSLTKLCYLSDLVMCHDLEFTWGFVTNAVFGAAPGHKVIARAREMCSKLSFDEIVACKDIVLQTGPRLFGQALMSSQREASDRTWVMLEESFFHCDEAVKPQGSLNSQIPLKTFGRHLRMATWRKKT